MVVANSGSRVGAVERPGAWRRLGAVAVTVVLLVSVALLASRDASGVTGPLAVPPATCGPGALPESSTQGRVPAEDYASGRVKKGYLCNTQQVGHQGSSGGFKTLRYTDAAGRTCAYYDSTLTVPRDVVSNVLSGDGLGTVVLDMTNPAKPRRTTNLTSVAMLSPHESLLLNEKRGLLVGVLGTFATAPGILDVYDIKTDCRKPKLLSSTPAGLLGHESGFAPDGKTLYVSSAFLSFVAVDLTNPRAPRPIHSEFGVLYHGMRLADDGKTLYAASLGQPGPGGITGNGLTIVDVSEIQDRKKNPKAKILSKLTWHGASIPQVAEPFTNKGRKYVLEIDEFVDLVSFKGLVDLNRAPVGAARIIDVQDPKHPRVVSDIRLKVHEPSQRGGAQKGDPGASFVAQGYAGHYCSMPTRKDPKIAGCSMILSGLRLFDISDVTRPREVGYFNKPVPKNTKITVLPAVGAYAMSQPAWDVRNDAVWYTDANSGFYVVRLTNGIEKLLP